MFQNLIFKAGQHRTDLITIKKKGTEKKNKNKEQKERKKLQDQLAN